MARKSGNGNRTRPTPAGAGDPPPAPENKGRYLTYMVIAGVLLGAVLVLTIVFASGVLRFGLEGPFIYIVYVLLGLLAAVLCYGVLDSVGEIRGRPYSVNVRLGGAVVGLVVVAAGGGIYERFVRQPSSLYVRVFLYEGSKSSLVPVDGSVNLHLPTQLVSVRVEANGTALFQGLSASLRGRKVDISLASATYSLAEGSEQVVLTPDEPVYVQVRKKAPFAPGEAAAVDLEVVGGQAFIMPATPGFRSLDFELRARAKTERPLPLDRVAVVYLLRSDGNRLATIEGELHGGLLDRGAILQPDSPTSLFVATKLSDSHAALVDKGFMLQIVARYDRMYATGEASEFATLPFDYTSKNVQFH